MTASSFDFTCTEDSTHQIAVCDRPMPSALETVAAESKGGQQDSRCRADATPASDATASLPPVLRLESIEHDSYRMGTLSFATLFNNSAPIRVYWQSTGADRRLSPGCLVRVQWRSQDKPSTWGLLIRRLVPELNPSGKVDLFQTVPTQWVSDRGLIERASALWRQLPVCFRHLFNAILWERSRFQRYVMGPSSLANHHNDLNGNFRHSIEVAEHALSLAATNKLASTPIVLLGALIHDAAKADEYRFDHARGCYEMTEQGILVGHRDRLQHWIAAAMAKHDIVLPELHCLGLLHTLTAAKGAPAHLGLREPLSIEATILSAADRVSGQTDLYSRLSGGGTGFGEYHRHLHGRPFVTGPAEVELCP